MLDRARQPLRLRGTKSREVIEPCVNGMTVGFVFPRIEHQAGERTLAEPIEIVIPRHIGEAIKPASSSATHIMISPHEMQWHLRRNWQPSRSEKLPDHLFLGG